MYVGLSVMLLNIYPIYLCLAVQCPFVLDYEFSQSQDLCYVNSDMNFLSNTDKKYLYMG